MFARKIVTAAAAVALTIMAGAGTASAQEYPPVPDDAPTTTAAPAEVDGVPVATVEVSDTVVVAGEDVVVENAGWDESTEVQIWLFSDPVLLKTVTASANGVVSANVEIPASAPAGQHHLVLRGVGADGAARELSVPVTVVADSDLPFTGQRVPASALPIAAAVLALGTVLVLVGRRRTR